VILIGCGEKVTAEPAATQRNQQLDTASAARLAFDETFAFKLQHHPVDARRRHLKEPLEVSLCRRGSVDLRVGVDEGKVLALQVSEGSSGSCGNCADRDDRRRMIVSALPCKEARMNVRYVVTLTDAERDQLKEMVAKGSKLARKVRKRRFCWRRMVARATKRLRGWWSWERRRSTGSRSDS
jgi:hypothetical protein